MNNIKKLTLLTLATTLVSALPTPKNSTQDLSWCFGEDGSSMQVCNHYNVSIAIIWLAPATQTVDWVPSGVCSPWRFNRNLLGPDITPFIFYCPDQAICHPIVELYGNNPLGHDSVGYSDRSCTWTDKDLSIGDQAGWEGDDWSVSITLTAVDSCVPQFMANISGTISPNTPSNGGFCQNGLVEAESLRGCLANVNPWNPNTTHTWKIPSPLTPSEE